MFSLFSPCFPLHFLIIIKEENKCMESGGLPSGDVVTAGKRPSHLVGWPFYNMWSGGVPRDEEFQENGNGLLVETSALSLDLSAVAGLAP